RDVFASAHRGLDLPPRSIHELRHSRLAPLGGQPLHYVSRRQGHASINLTADLYGHMLPDTERDDAETFAAIMATAAQARQSARDQMGTKHAPNGAKTRTK
ncbi:MAG TPA: hypothetical protein VFU72_15700, partial [Nitrolancea sp.]|nr:hypothetical protein [Nitrolancea sp.]